MKDLQKGMLHFLREEVLDGENAYKCDKYVIYMNKMIFENKYKKKILYKKDATKRREPLKNMLFEQRPTF